jgi:hypothetical protein
MKPMVQVFLHCYRALGSSNVLCISPKQPRKMLDFTTIAHEEHGSVPLAAGFVVIQLQFNRRL